MGYIHINRFQGIAPRIAPRKLGPNQAQVARNVNIFSHELKALQSNIQVFTPSKEGTIKSIYPLGAYWMHWTDDVDVIRTPQDLAESYGDRVHYTGHYNPKSTDDTLVHASPGTAYPTDYYRLGVPRPDTAPTVGHTGGTGTAVDRAYVYSFITAWGEEGPPSPVGTHTGVDDASSWNLTGIDATPPNSGNISAVTVNATTVDITFDTSHFLEETEYVTLGGTIVATGDLATDLAGTFQVTERLAVDEIRITLTTNGAYTSGGTWEREAPLQTTGWTKYIYRSLDGTFKYVGSTTGTTFNDTVADADLGEDLPGDVIEGDWYKAPNGNMKGIIALANGVCAGFYGKVLALTPEYIPSAWPTNYRVKFDFDVVAIAVLGNTVVVATTGQPYLVIVDDPSAAVSSKLEFFQPCISKRSMKGLQNGVCYACPDGVAYVPSAGLPKVITKPLAKKKDWDLFNPSSMLAEVYDDRYYLFYSDGGSDGDENGGLIFDPEEPEATFTQLTGLITAAHKIVETDTLYLMDADQGTISKYDSGGSFQTYQWLSKRFTMALPTCLKTALVRFTMEEAIASYDPSSAAEAIAAAVTAKEEEIAETELSPLYVGESFALFNIVPDGDSMNPQTYTNAAGVSWKPDGTMFYSYGTAYGVSVVYQHSLTTAWDVSTASYDSKNKNISGLCAIAVCYGVDFSADGTKMYASDTGQQKIYQFALSTAWDVSTATYTSVLDLSATITSARDFKFKADGTKLFICDETAKKIHEVTLSTPWDITTGTITYSFTSSELYIRAESIDVKPDGTEMYITDAQFVRQYKLTTAWDLSTASYRTLVHHFVYGTQVQWSDSGTKIMVYRIGTNTLYGFDASYPWFVDLNLFIDYESITSETTTPNGLFIHPDGSRLWTTKDSFGYLYEYTMSTPLDLTTYSNTDSLNVDSQTAHPRGIFFNSDGTKLFISGDKKIFSYDLSTGYDLSTASYVATHDVSAEITGPHGCHFNPDGTKMYIGDYNTAKVYQYSLSTAWDITTLSYDSVSLTFTNYIQGITFDLTGQYLYINQNQNYSPYHLDRYILSTPWDLSTAVKDQHLSLPSAYGGGLAISTDGHHLYFIDTYNNRIYQMQIGQKIT